MCSQSHKRAHDRNEQCFFIMVENAFFVLLGGLKHPRKERLHVLEAEHAIGEMTVNFHSLPAAQIHQAPRPRQHLQDAIDVVHQRFAGDGV